MRRSILLASGCSLGLFVLFGQLSARQTSGQQPVAAQLGQPGRFQLATGIGCICVIDTTSGHCWYTSDLEGKKWNDLGSPVEAKKEQ